MALTPSKFNSFIMFKLPSAWLCGVRVKEISETTCKTSVKHKWINQNPFNSMFWAVQGMAAELSTGAMVINQIKESGKKISMLVANNKASFTKKATGKIIFTCNDGHKIADAIEKTIATGEGQTFWMQSIGMNEDGVVVSTFDFEWTVKVKS
ncbi:DUF4442 domain-containing protein [Leeuwenhoekiella palythoae]|uniref:Acyl-coenzyme A thioesterase PaaI, contains HGG motif n=1 Tax=Leeuwenhoekiella palythoae TaxID=573501 RepID=A0A1M5ZLK7_9FLAO|nr:DUF4442 domain-containing protein [Leeuwenhoekiella palythoae]RXG26986.1 putative protein DUF4442 [Leeuwenhoekiella palythoae]SHI25197.1 protein of unknown function [Leeuwenhoekiella palythoae]